MEDIMSVSDDRPQLSQLASFALPRFACLSLLIATGCSDYVHSVAKGDPFEGAANTAVARVVYVGTYTNGPPGRPKLPDGGVDNGNPPSQGIYVFRMDPHNGNLTQLQVVQASNPSYLALDSTMTHLYSDNENGTGMYAMDHMGGSVTAYSIGSDGTLTSLNTLPSMGDWPTYIRVHPGNQFIYAANYGTGNFPVYQTKADGSLAMMSDLAQDMGDGSGPDGAPNSRQTGPHAHEILADSTGMHVFGVDLGADRISIWNLDPTTGKLSPNTVPYAGMPAGTGPRHMVFDKGEKHAYVLSEFTSSVFVFDYDSSRGALTWLQTQPGLPETEDPTKNHAAEIRLHPSGKFLYTTIRAEDNNDSVAIFGVDSTSGKLSNIAWQPVDHWPRGMNIDPSGMFLYVGSENKDKIDVFAIGQTSGKLTPMPIVDTPVPVDIEFGAKL
jgi:6-phosphogluconolactonase